MKGTHSGKDEAGGEGGDPVLGAADGRPCSRHLPGALQEAAGVGSGWGWEGWKATGIVLLSAFYTRYIPLRTCVSMTSHLPRITTSKV